VEEEEGGVGGGGGGGGRRRRRKRRRRRRRRRRKKAFETKNISWPPTPLPSMTWCLHYTVGCFCKILQHSWLSQHHQWRLKSFGICGFVI